MNEERKENLAGKYDGTRRRARIVLVSAILASCGPSLLFATYVPVAAQAARGPVQRSLVGKVETKQGEAIKGAVVYLKDEHSQAVRSAISGEDGSYRFVQLAYGTNFDVWAQIDAKRSKAKTISSFDTKNAFAITLQIDK